ncbi:MAG: 3-isopropylmalate dehydrogenase [Candidatus Rokubacteria bacterium]|nr:3-isopropylmalate dehydrogenase [Candidatus Rokubacteria bacterium]
MASYRIAVLPGDGIGVEVTREAVRVLQAVAKSAGVGLELEEGIIGGAAIDAHGTPLPEATLRLCQQSHAVLFGAVGGPKWDHLRPSERPEAGILRIRKSLDLYANLRPARLFPMLVDASPLKREVVEGADLMVIRELTAGLYFGEPRGLEGTGWNRRGFNTMVYTAAEIERIARLAFQVARTRRKHLTSVDKSNVLVVSQLWREVVTEVSKAYPDVTLEHLLVDNCAMALVASPRRFDTIVTENTFGDILSDEAAVLAGSMGMLPSASLGGSREGSGGREAAGRPGRDHLNIGLYEPIHGTAPDIAGQGIANPLAAILSAAMLLRHSLDRPKDADRVERAVERVLEAGYRTKDVHTPGTALVGTSEMGSCVVRELEALYA